MLEGLLPGRMELYKAAVTNRNKYPNNYLSAATLAIVKGEVIKVLYEYAFILENRPVDQIDKEKIKKIRGKMEKILSD